MKAADHLRGWILHFALADVLNEVKDILVLGINYFGVVVKQIGLNRLSLAVQAAELPGVRHDALVNHRLDRLNVQLQIADSVGALDGVRKNALIPRVEDRRLGRNMLPVLG